MKHFVLAITTYNRLPYLKDCVNSWVQTKSNTKWTLIIADDGSDDGTLDYLSKLKIDNTHIHLIQNNRSGIHNQMNSILKYLGTITFDFCFKADDDITFLKEGWDEKYFSKSEETGYHHLIFCEKTWGKEQFFESPLIKNGLESNYTILNVHGFFYTISPKMLKDIGGFDTRNFGFRGMGHVDYSARACRAGFNDLNNPFDIEKSKDYLSANKEEYKSALDDELISAYDNLQRERKEKLILEERTYIAISLEESINYKTFKDELPLAFKNELKLKNEEIEWYKNTYEVLPKWWKKIGAFIRKT